MASPPWHLLRQAVDGDVIRQPEPATFNAQFDGVRAQAAVRCTSPHDVAATLSFVRRHDLPFAVRSGGHCFAGHSSTTGVVLDMTPMDQIRLHGEVVTVDAGARLGAIYDRLHDDGRVLPAGTCPSVGIAGLALGGGLGVLGRRYGLTSDQMVSAQVVLADGDVVFCDESHEPDLFWALRGAGAGNFGVVTSFSFRTEPAPQVVDFHLAWNFDLAAAVIEAWQAWAPVAPDELAASLKVIAPGDPDRAPAVNVYGALQTSAPDAPTVRLLHSAIDHLRRRVGAEPAWQWAQRHPFAQSRRFWAQLPPPGAAFEALAPPAEAHPWLAARSEFFRRPLPTRAVTELLEVLAAGRRRGEERELDFMPWGGAYNRVPADATAFVHRHELFQLKHSATLGPDATSGAKEAAHAFVRRSWELTHTWGSGGVFPAFPDSDLPKPPEAYFGGNLPRLRRIKAHYDPANVFGSPSGQGIDP
jgi:FAD/FMN-containing dehydrogenase